MRKQRTTYDQAIIEYTAFYGTAPTYNQITATWHGYANEWKHFNGFTDWLTYHA